MRTCEVCGCTDDRACVKDGHACHWAGRALCSACAEKLLQEQPPGGADVAVRELKKLESLKLDLDPGFALCLISTIQLACRHPGFNGATRMEVEKFARDLQQEVATTRDLALLFEMGWRPQFDVPNKPSLKKRQAEEGEIDSSNKFAVSGRGKLIVIMLPPPKFELTRADAINLAAWLVAIAGGVEELAVVLDKIQAA